MPPLYAPALRTKIPALAWGDSYANTLEFGHPGHEPRTYTLPAPGHAVTRGRDGGRDGWSLGHDQFLALTLRAIPPVNPESTDPETLAAQEAANTTNYGVVQTGWDGAAGVHAFLKWARGKRLVRVYPDRTESGVSYDCYLTEPMSGAPEPEHGETRRTLRLVFRVADGTPVEGY